MEAQKDNITESEKIAMLQNAYLKRVYEDTVARNSDQTEFLQAVLEDLLKAQELDD